MKKPNLRLLLFEECDRACEGCCNKDWDMQAVPVAESYEDYELIMLTGGEPMIKPALIHWTIAEIRRQNHAVGIVLYTANTTSKAWKRMIPYLDGITMTIHEQSDVQNFMFWLGQNDFPSWMTLRLNVFKGIEFDAGIMDFLEKSWQVKKDIEWIKDCPVPSNEDFRRL
jgi:pyruvate-formate lyase-activating enzyme